MAWLYADDDKGFIPCCRSASAEMEAALQKRMALGAAQPQCVDMMVAGSAYRVDVLLWEQYNKSSKRMRALRRVECPRNVCWEVEKSGAAKVLLAAPEAAASAAFLPLSPYWSALLEYLRDRATSPLHSAYSARVTVSGDDGDVVLDAKAMQIQHTSFGGLVSCKGSVRRVLHAVNDAEDDDLEAHASGGDAKRTRLEGGRRVPKTADGAPAAAHTPAGTSVGVVVPVVASSPVKRSPLPHTLVADPSSPGHSAAVAVGSEVATAPRTVSDETDDVKAVRKRGPGFSSVALASSHPLPPSPLYRLLFPSISTAVFMFDLSTAARIACGVIAKFLTQFPASTHPWIQLCLIDAPSGADTDTIKAFKKEWSTISPPGETRFSFIAADVGIVEERKSAGFIANASNASFNGGVSTGGFNRALYVAAGDRELQEDTRNRYVKGGTVGPCYDVPLRTTSPLYAEGTRYILHVVGPNMNPSRPNCLYDDYKAGSEQLTDCYRNLFDTYYRLASAMIREGKT